MKARNFGLLAGLALCGSAGAAEFGIMETAETIAPKAFKLVGYSLLADREGGDEGAFAVGLGYGLPYKLDVEGRIARYDEASYYGSDIEWNAWSRDNVRFSFGGGVHTVDFDGGGSANGIDTTAIFTFTPVRRLEVNAAFDASFEDVNRGNPASPNVRHRFDNQHETYYFAPGLEYQMTRNLDLLAEVGVGLNDTSDDYMSGGLSWYFR